MNIQLKKGILDVLVLWLLKKKDTYGYKLSEEINNVVNIAETALYPILRRLTVQGLLSSYSIQYNSRLRKYYHLTDEGLTELNIRKEGLRELSNVINMLIEEDN